MLPGPILVVAGAGSGKTRVLTHRLAYLVNELNVSPFEVLAITFTNKAAGEMRDRVAQLIGPVGHRMWVSTFHAACSRILRREATLLGYRSSFTIYDQSDAVRLTDWVRRDLNLDPKRYPARQLHSQISSLKNELVLPAQYAEMAVGPAERRVAEIYAEYQRRLAEASAVDFDDLLVLVVRLFREFPEVLARYQHRFKHVLVDEFQDTNIAQWELVRLLTREHRSIMIVGDDAQCLATGTQITMGDGSHKTIELVESGDEVLSNYGSGDFRLARVIRTHKASRTQGVQITLQSGRQLISTKDHVHFAASPGASLTGLYDRSTTHRAVGRRAVVEMFCERAARPVHRVSVGAHEVRSTDMGAIADAAPRDVDCFARLTADQTFAFTSAASVRPGMVMVDESGRFDVVQTVEFVQLDAPV
ncbi:MAG TPA: UvrD-helicase domain-containing protein, partial [Acidimicrobiia bacterium]|nr:UvrD-helicase domain-containing protein [Acidimicrobiia bacterium]